MVNAEAEQRVTLRRLVLAGEQRRIDLVLPAHAPIGELLPEILRTAGDRTAGDRTAHEPPTCRLVTAGGAVLAWSETLASANVTDGSVVRLVREHGVSEPPAGRSALGETTGGPRGQDDRGGHADHGGDGGHEGRDDHDRYVWRWDERSRTGAAVAAAVLLTVVACVFAGRQYGLDRAALWLGLATVAATGAGAAAGLLLTRKAPATALLLVGGTLGVSASWGAAPGGAPRLAAVGLTVAVVLALLGLCTGLGRGGLVGAAAVAAAVGGWAIGLVVADPARTGVVLGVVSVLVLGHLPRLALSSAGLTRLDDRHSGGAPVSRYRAAAALGATHRGLTLAAVTTAMSAGAGGVLAVGGTGDASGTVDGWAVAAAVLLSVVLFSRARAYPLALEVVALLVAGAAVCVRLVLLWGSDGGDPTAALTVLSLSVAVPLAALAVRPPEHVRLRMRHLTNLVEAVSVVALIPVAVGALGVYGGLPDMF
ncbi:EsaB/YukD family protein [Streptomyces sp. NPDC045470]|uniref:EsaB/YukD family protein n=1 Tax=Streptomyces sp. NPDC045470 TaxID=3155469 RepID=UPI0033E40D53